MARSRWLALTLACALCACGEDAPAGRGEPPPTVDPTPAPVPEAPPLPVREAAIDVPLDDATLEKLLAMHREVLAAGDDLPTIMALGAGTTWNYQTYARALGRWQAIEDATGDGAASARAELAKLDQRLADLAKEAQGASGIERKRIEQEQADLQRMRPTLAELVEQLKSVADPKTKALVDRWKPRFDALEAEFRR